MRFARENSNDKGEKLTLETSNLIINEFKYYIWSCWVILKPNLPPKKEQNDLDELENAEAAIPVEEVEGIWAPYPPGPLVGKVHDTLITYSYNYREFC